ncbi:hypothetical protein PoB_003157800 [Plakobranchus ocellatus]|uniref:Uncharacterized protein n=1 Tax=Plakobranchus ocellatus TaxID=259542 RepID=A0AAV4AE43_9GAST|nr:hypothetical protein PoB_003157800 [Plakobranchus ocellatus]
MCTDGSLRVDVLNQPSSREEWANIPYRDVIVLGVTTQVESVTQQVGNRAVNLQFEHSDQILKISSSLGTLTQYTALEITWK